VKPFFLSWHEPVTQRFIFMEDVVLELTDFTSYLRMRLDEGLTWNEYVDKVCSMETTSINALHMLSKTCLLKF